MAQFRLNLGLREASITEGITGSVQPTICSCRTRTGVKNKASCINTILQHSPEK